MMHRAALLLSALALTACGAKRVPSALLEKLPYESRIELLEAENDLALAVDHLDEAQSEVSRSRDGIRRAKARLSAAKEEVDNAEDAQSKEVAELAVAEAEARVDLMRARQAVNVEMLALKTLELQCARARFELARLTVARKAKVEGSEKLSPEAFEAQAKSCDAKAAERKVEMKVEEAAAEAAHQAWEAKRGALAKKTFDARASPYVE